MKQAETNISIVIPTFQRENVLLDTLSSLFTLPVAADEILVVDQSPCHDPATDTALTAWQDAGLIRHIRRSTPGVVGAMNLGLAEAKSPLVLFLDDDIVPDTNLIQAHVQAHATYSEAWAVAGQVLQPGEDPDDLGARPPRTGLRADFNFPFHSSRADWIYNVMAGNLSVKRGQLLGIGGFDENFLPPVSYRFETDLARRIGLAGGRIRFEPAASIRHLRAPSGGTRSLGSHLTSASPLHGVGDYLFALHHGRGLERLTYLLTRPFREVRTKFHLLHPWWIPVKFVGEVRALMMALELHRRKLH